METPLLRPEPHPPYSTHSRGIYHRVVLSGTNNLKLVWFFKVGIAVRLQYCITYVSGMHNAVVLCICICACLATLMLKCNQEVIAHTDLAVLQ